MIWASIVFEILGDDLKILLSGVFMMLASLFSLYLSSLNEKKSPDDLVVKSHKFKAYFGLGLSVCCILFILFRIIK